MVHIVNNILDITHVTGFWETVPNRTLEVTRYFKAL